MRGGHRVGQYAVAGSQQVMCLCVIVVVCTRSGRARRIFPQRLLGALATTHEFYTDAAGMISHATSIFLLIFSIFHAVPFRLLPPRRSQASRADMYHISMLARVTFAGDSECVYYPFLQKEAVRLVFQFLVYCLLALKRRADKCRDGNS